MEELEEEACEVGAQHVLPGQVPGPDHSCQLSVHGLEGTLILWRAPGGQANIRGHLEGTLI